MALHEAYSAEGNGTLFNLTGDDDLRVGAGVELLSFGDLAGNTAAIQGLGSDHAVRVLGVVRSFDCAVELGGAAQDQNARLTIEAGGIVASLGGARGAVHVVSQAFQIFNRGSIVGAVGLNVATEGGLASWIENRGLITGTSEGIVREDLIDGAAGKVVLINRGLISGGLSAYESRALEGDDIDVVHNYGRMVGDVRLGGGADLYVGHGSARVNGRILGGEGNDVFRPGAARERMEGGLGYDVLDFSAGAAVTVALNGALTGKGRAAGDVYSGFEVVYGSRRWGDWLRGGDADDSLYGLGGNDRLIGGEGGDYLVGGAGHDRLTGGAGGDDFVFRRPSEGGDLITDFDSESEGVDRIVVDLAGFRSDLGLGPVTGALIPQETEMQANGLSARLVIETGRGAVWFDFKFATGALWFDADGAGRAKPVFLARLAIGQPLLGNQILLLGAGGVDGFDL